jgi:hypothetical protein
MNPLFIVIFEDNTSFSGGCYKDSKWLQIPPKKLQSLFYLLPSGDYIYLTGYDKYYTTHEIAIDIVGGNGEQKIKYAYVMGKKNKTCTQYKIDLRTGKIEIKILDEEDKEIKKFNTIGWK